MKLLQRTVLKMLSNWRIVLACTLFAFCESAFVDTLAKCEIGDTPCQKDLIQNVLKSISKSGIPEINVAPIDPITLHNITVAVLDLFKINLEDVVGTGIKDCVIDNVNSEIAKGHVTIEITCDIKIKGKFTLEQITPAAQNLFGTSNSTQANGKAKVKLDKLHLKLQYFYDVIKQKDGEIYLQGDTSKTLYDYDVDNIKIVLENIVLGGQDVSKTINTYLNENGKSLFKTFGKNFIEVAVGILNKILQSFFNTYPAKHYVSSDLSPYLKN